MEPSDDKLEAVLARAESGDASAATEILPLVYDDLRRLAQWHLSKEKAGGAGQTLQATALVHEAYLRITKGRKLAWEGKRHFYAAAALAMRRLLVERARRLGESKAREERVELQEALVAARESNESSASEQTSEVNWVAFDEAMAELGREDPELAEVVHLRYFAGLSVDETAMALASSARTVDRRWKLARAWLADWVTRKGRDDRFLG